MGGIVKDKNLVAACGLYCGACRAFLKGNCPGCAKNIKAEKWCKVKLCCRENSYKSCSDCKEHPNPDNCIKFNNIFSQIFKIIFRSNRKRCIEVIREKGYENYVEEAAERGIYNGKDL